MAEWRGETLHAILSKTSGFVRLLALCLVPLLLSPLLLPLYLLSLPLVAVWPPLEGRFKLHSPPLLKFMCHFASDVLLMPVLMMQLPSETAAPAYHTSDTYVREHPLLVFSLTLAIAIALEEFRELCHSIAAMTSHTDGRITYFADPLNAIDATAIGLSCAALIARVAESPSSATLLSLAVLCLTLRVLHLFRMLPTIGPLILMMVKMLFKDIFNWLALLMIVLLALGSALYVLHVDGDAIGEVGVSDYVGCVDSEAVWLIDAQWMRWGWYVLHTWEGALLSAAPFECARYSVMPYLSVSLLYIQQMVVALLLINMLIAMMGKSFDIIYEAQSVNSLYLFSQTVAKWREKSIAPPPLNLLSLPYVLGRGLLWCCAHWRADTTRKLTVAEKSGGSPCATIWKRYKSLNDPEAVGRNIASFISLHENDVALEELWRTKMQKKLGEMHRDLKHTTESFDERLDQLAKRQGEFAALT